MYSWGRVRSGRKKHGGDGETRARTTKTARTPATAAAAAAAAVFRGCALYNVRAHRRPPPHTLLLLRPP